MTEDRTGTPPSVDASAADGLDALTDEVLPALIARLRASRLGELEVSTSDWRVRIRREAAPAAGHTAGSASSGNAGADVETEGAAFVRSPAVGYFIVGPDLTLGRSVESGDSLGGVDVLGIVQDVLSPSDGVISRVSAEAGQAVEYGQVLIEIDRLGAVEVVD